MMKNSTKVRTLATAGAMVLAMLAGAGPVSATDGTSPSTTPGSARSVPAPINDAGPAAGTYTSFAGCSGQVHKGYEQGSGTAYARGQFSLGTSTRGYACWGWLERRKDSSSAFERVSDYHTASDSTGWYYSQDPVQSRVCIGDFLYANSYSCVGYW
ncbi:hypothetical protein [Streptomyces netropsis]|nr:hypothetical protein [Streptomyces netropsis]